MVKSPNIVCVAGPEELAEKALEIFDECFSRAVAERERFFVAFSGGKTPEKFFQLLGQSGKTQGRQWDKAELFWADERCVAPERHASNFGLAAGTFLHRSAIRQSNIHRIRCEHRTPQQAASEYEKTIKDVFGRCDVEFDLILLGLGRDGHIASLMPGSDALKITDRLTAAVVLSAKDYPRITLTASVLCSARKLVVMISGAEKQSIVKTIFTSEPRPDLWPVHLLWPALDRVVWLIDKSACGELSFEGSGTGQ